MHKAIAGGEVGANGEFYKGGQFVADNADTIKGDGYRPRGPRKVCIAPYQWVEADGKTFGIFGELERGQSIRYTTKWVDEEDGESKPVYSDFCLSLPIECYDIDSAIRSRATHGRLKLKVNYDKEAWFKRWRNYHGTLLAKWLAGERFISIEDLANLAAVCAGHGRMDIGDFATIDVNDTEACAALVAPAATVEDEVQMRRRLTSGKGYVGGVGEKMERDVEITGAIPYENDFGGGTIYKFVDGDGNELVWMTSAGLKTGQDEYGRDTYAGVGDRLRIKFTVKGHDTYADVPQTKITRVKAVA